MLSSRNTNRNGYAKLFCDQCGRQTDYLEKVTGHWMNSNTKRMVISGVGWVCQACLASIRKEGHK